MRVLTVSDLHVDYPENLEWVLELSPQEYREDVLIVAGDICDRLDLLGRVLSSLKHTFREVCFVPGNHELWVAEEEASVFSSSLEKFHAVIRLCEQVGVHTSPLHIEDISIVPLFSWYDFSFGEPDRYLRRAWRDFRSCVWPEQLNSVHAVTDHFLRLNQTNLNVQNDLIISFSHFLPRIDVMPATIPEKRRKVYPVLGSDRLGEQVQQLEPDIHIYGHSHVNRDMTLDGINYVNNAFAYPSETRISRKDLHCVYQLESGVASSGLKLGC